MDDHPPTVNQDCSSADAEPLLDSVTAELKAEFARLEREAALRKSAFRILREALEEVQRPNELNSNQAHRVIKQHSVIRVILESLDCIESLLGHTPSLQRQMQFWTAALKFNRDALAKLQALLAHSLQATFRTPLLLDGPELSGYKHRLR